MGRLLQERHVRFWFVVICVVMSAQRMSAQAAPRPGLFAGVGLVAARAQSDTTNPGSAILAGATLGFAPTARTAIALTVDYGVSFGGTRTSALGHFDVSGRAYAGRSRVAPFIEIGLTSRLAEIDSDSYLLGLGHSVNGGIEFFRSGLWSWEVLVSHWSGRDDVMRDGHAVARGFDGTSQRIRILLTRRPPPR
jgi:hypothetical protein